MRPITRGSNPTSGDFADYQNAFPFLAGRLGFYCSYCERRISPNLAVEHIQAKDLPQYHSLRGTWENFLLACTNCNSTKAYKDVGFAVFYLPDRDNTFAAFAYTSDGCVAPAAALSPAQDQIARDTLALMGLDKPPGQKKDENGEFVAADRIRQRKGVWMMAEELLSDLQNEPSDPLRRAIVKNAIMSGFFRVWMTVFAQDIDMRRRFIEAFPNTARDCFDAAAQPTSPRPNNGLAHAGKI